MKKDPRLHRIRKDRWHYNIEPNLQVSIIAFNALLRQKNKVIEDVTTSMAFYRMIEYDKPEHLITPKTGKAGTRGVTPVGARAMCAWRVPFRARCENFDKEQALNQTVQHAEKKVAGHERNYKEATRGLRDDIAIAAIQGLCAHHGMAIDPAFATRRAYELADRAIEERKGCKLADAPKEEIGQETVWAAGQ